MRPGSFGKHRHPFRGIQSRAKRAIHRVLDKPVRIDGILGRLAPPSGQSHPTTNGCEVNQPRTHTPILSRSAALLAARARTR